MQLQTKDKSENKNNLVELEVNIHESSLAKGNFS